ncbi:MAG: hypothetical protein IKU55_01250 [Clostridia bacterium]|nr:hypothetical protein [Clostridia bacterium]
MLRRICGWLLTVCTVLALSGCLAFNSTDLLTLPEISPEHRELLKLINNVTASSAWVTTNPVAGDSKLTTQFVDLYQDGIPEALAFFKNPTDFTLRLSIYTKTGKSTYSELCTIEMAGEQFHRIDCVDVNGDGNRELVVGIRYATSAMYGLNVYAVKNGEGILLTDTTYTDLVVYDLTADSVADIVTINTDESGTNAYAELFAHAETGITSLGRAPISAAVRTPSAMICGELNDSMRAVIVEGGFTDSTGTPRYLSDVLTCRDGSFTNLSYAEIYHQSFETQRSVALTFADVDLNGYLEFPIAFSMPQPPNVTVAGGICVRWFGYTSTGEVKAVTDTYHASDNRWFFTLPQAWNDRVYVKSVTGEGYRAGEFVIDVNGTAQTLLTIYMFNTESARLTSDVANLIFLPEYNGVYYAAIATSPDELPKDAKDLALSAEEVAERLVFVSAGGDYRRASTVR